ncbi:MAG: cytochrome b/b6 domain-containing protein [Bacteroidetes bacterium]|nr:cytochrome b/b6 domain-containing protein [Bacteroidota bacterium]
MVLIEPIKKDRHFTSPAKKYSAPFRFWHWVNMCVIGGSLITVLLNSTLIDQQNINPLIKDELKNKGITITEQQAGSVGHALEDKVWEIHTYFGYILAALLVFRLILEFYQLADQKLIRKLKDAYAQFHATKKNRELARHELLVKAIYAAFYILLLIMALTGLFLAFEDLLAPFKSIRHSIKEVHGFCMYLILAFVAVHLAGVFLAERNKGKGIVSDMINGG